MDYRSERWGGLVGGWVNYECVVWAVGGGGVRGNVWGEGGMRGGGVRRG